jgi:hypothetical protein
MNVLIGHLGRFETRKIQELSFGVVDFEDFAD